MNNRIKNKFGHPIRILHVDNGAEFKNRNFKDYLNREGIELETIAPYTPEQNGRIERENRTIMETVRSMLTYAESPLYMWAAAATLAIYVLNRTPSSHLEITPFEAWTGEKPYLGNVKTFVVLLLYINQIKRGLSWIKKARN